MPPVPRNSFFLVRHATTNTNPNSTKSMSKVRKRMKNSLHESRQLTSSYKLSRGEGSMVDGGPSLQERSITGERMTMNHSIPSALDQSSSAYDPTRRAPLMCTRRLFGKLESGIVVEQNDSEAMSNNGSSVGEGLYDESIELLKFRDGEEDLQIRKQRPSTAPMRQPDFAAPSQMRMTVVVRKDRHRKGISKRTRTQSEANIDSPAPEHPSMMFHSAGESDEDATSSLPPDMAQLTDVFMPNWTVVPVCIVYPVGTFHEELKLLKEDVFPRVNEELRSHQVCIYLLGAMADVSSNTNTNARTGATFMSSMNVDGGSRVARDILSRMQNVDICRNSICLVLKGDEYGKPLTSQTVSDAEAQALRSRGYSSLIGTSTTSRYDILIRHALRRITYPNAAPDSTSSTSATKSRVAQMRSGWNRTGSRILCYERAQSSMGSAASAVALEEFVDARRKDGEVDVREFSSLLSFCDMTTEDLLFRITTQFPKKITASNLSQQSTRTATWYRQEYVEHSLVKNAHISRGEASPGLLEGVAESVRMNTGMSPVVVVGSPGRGKSHSMAVLVDFIESAGNEWTLVSHFVGASVLSRQLSPMLVRLCAELSEHCLGAETGALSLRACQSYPALCSEFHMTLRRASNALAAQGRTLVVLIDSIDQLDSDLGRLEWLPTVVPANMQFVLSCNSQSDATKRLAYRYGQLQTFDLDRDPLSNLELLSILENNLKMMGVHSVNSLHQDIVQASRSVVTRHRGSNALYMRAAAWRLYRGATCGLPNLLDAIPRTLPKLLEDELHHADVDLREWFLQQLQGQRQFTETELSTLAIQSHDVFASIMASLWASHSALSFVEFVQLVDHLLSLSAWNVEQDAIETAAEAAARDQKDASAAAKQQVLAFPKLDAQALALRVVASLGPHVGTDYFESGCFSKIELRTAAVRDCLKRTYLKTPVLQARAFGQMAAFSLKTGDPLSQGTWEKGELESSGTTTCTTASPGGTLEKSWSNAVEYIVTYQLAGHEVLGLRATLCNPWYIQARCEVATLLPSGIDRLLFDIKTALKSLANTKYVSLHSSIFQPNPEELHQQLADVSDAITEVFQFIMYNRSTLATRPRMTLQLALSEWMTRLPSTIVDHEIARARATQNSGVLNDMEHLFHWRNKARRFLRLTAHIGFGDKVMACGVSHLLGGTTNVSKPSSFLALGMGCGRIFVVDSLSGDTAFVLEDAPVAYAETKPARNSTRTTSISQVCFSSDNQMIIARQGHDVTIWMLPFGETSYRLPSNMASCFSLGDHLNAPNDMLFVGNSKGYVSTWNISMPLLNADGIHLMSESFVSSSPITSTACSSKTMYVASGSADGTVVIWQAAQGQLSEHARISGYVNSMGPIAQLKFRSDGQRIAACSVDSPVVKVWDIHGSLSREFCAGNATGGVRCIEWSHDMRMIVTVPAVGTHVSVWDAESSNRIANLGGHHRSVNCMAFVWIPTSQDKVMCSLVTGADDALVRFWNFSGMLPGAPGRDYFQESDAASLGENVATTVWNNQGNNPDPAAGKEEEGRAEEGDEEKKKAAEEEGEGKEVEGKHSSISLIGDQHRSRDAALMDDLTRAAKFKDIQRQRSALCAHDGAVSCSAGWSGKMDSSSVVATGGIDGVIRLWSLPDHTHVASLAGDCIHKKHGSVLALAFSPAGDLLASWIDGIHGGLFLWDVKHQSIRWNIAPPPHIKFPVTHLRFHESHADASALTLMVSGRRGRLSLVKAATGEQIATEFIHVSQIDRKATKNSDGLDLSRGRGGGRGEEEEGEKLGEKESAATAQEHATIVDACFSTVVNSEGQSGGRVAAVDSAGVLRTYDAGSLTKTGDDVALCMGEDASIVVGAWVGPRLDAHVISVVASKTLAQHCSIRVTPGGGCLEIPVSRGAACSAFAIAQPSLAWAAIGWDDGTVVFCRIIGQGGLRHVGTVMCPDAVSTITILYHEKAGECSFTCCDVSGNMCTYAAPHETNPSEKELWEAGKAAKCAEAHDRRLSMRALPVAVVLKAESSAPNRADALQTAAAAAAAAAAVAANVNAPAGGEKVPGPERFFNDGVDRSAIERNKFGEEEPHTDEPELWNIDGTEMDLLAKYKVGGQMWYIQSRAKERAAHDPPLAIAGVPMNPKAVDANRLFED
jgi:WD40 repeat protein